MIPRDDADPGPAPAPVRVLLVEDHALIAQSLSLSLRDAGLDAASATLTSPDQLLQDVAADPPSVVLLDLDLGPIGDGLPLVEPLTASGAAVIVVSAVTDRRVLAEAVAAGAVGFLAKTQPFDVLVHSVVQVARGERLLSEQERHVLLRDLTRQRAQQRARLRPFKRLTPREAEALRALCAGRSVRELATEWVVSETTVRAHVRAIHTKLGVRSQLAAVAMARNSGWITATPNESPTR